MQRILGSPFVDANPPNTPGTIVTADFLNAVQEELAGAIEDLGGTLDGNDNGQLIGLLLGGKAYTMSTTGYLKLPAWLGGLIIQWGAVSVNESSLSGGYYSGAANVTFPIAFSDTPYRAFVSPVNTPNAMDSASAYNATTTGMTVVGATSSESAQSATVNWFVIGK